MIKNHSISLQTIQEDHEVEGKKSSFLRTDFARHKKIQQSKPSSRKVQQNLPESELILYSIKMESMFVF